MTVRHTIYLSHCEGEYVKLWQVNMCTETFIIIFKLSCIIDGALSFTCRIPSRIVGTSLPTLRSVDW